MNKTIVNVFALLLVVVLLAVPVFAGGDQPNLPEEHEQEAVLTENTGDQAHVAVCDHCLKGYVQYLRTDYGNEYFIGTIPYCHDTGATDHSDKVYTYSITKVYQCTYCGVQCPIEEDDGVSYRCP